MSVQKKTKQTFAKFFSMFIKEIHLLNKAEEQKLNEALISIADDLPQTRSRGFHR